MCILYTLFVEMSLGRVLAPIMPPACDAEIDCTNYLTISEKECQNNWQQLSTATSVGFTVIGTKGGKGFHLVRGTPRNQELYKSYLKMNNRR
jgi:hypothetical protein